MIQKKSMDDVEIIISRWLQFGVLLSAAIMLTGLIMFIITGQSGYPNGTYPTSFIVILQGIAQLKPYAIILFGLLILIITPVFRVGVSVIIFLKEKDYLYVRITLLVFMVLIISFLLGKVE